MRWVLLLLVAAAMWWPSPAAAVAGAGQDAVTGRGAGVGEGAGGRVAFIGVPGLLWDDLDPRDTPRLWELAGQSGLGSLSVKAVGTVTCPYDGWLSVSSGVRAAVGRRCGLSPEPVVRGRGAVVPGMGELHATRDGASAGTLGAAVHAAGHCTAAVGRGSALALADREGEVDLYAATPAELSDWSRCRVLAVDVAALIEPYLVDGRLPQEPEALTPGRRRDLARQADAEVGAALDRLPAGTEIVLAGIGDHGSTPHLRVALWKRAGTATPGATTPGTATPGTATPGATTPGTATPGTAAPGATTPGSSGSGAIPAARAEGVSPGDAGVRSGAGAGVRDGGGEVVGPRIGGNSARRDDIVLLPDVTPTVLTAAGIPTPPNVIGLPWRLGEPISSADLVRADLAGTTVRGMTGYFFTGFATLTVAFYVLSYFLLSRRRRLGFVGVAAIAMACVPVSTYVVNLLPWDHSPSIPPTLIGCVLAVTAVLSAIALLGPWRRDPLGPPAVVCVINFAVLVGDLLTGTNLQFNALMGYTAVVGGRYYGLANIPFALLATSVLMGAAVAAEHLVRAGRRRLAVAVVTGLGVVATLLAGWPGVGSDFGGVIAFAPGIAVTALLVAGKKVSVLKLAGFSMLGGVAVSVIAVLDWLRPPQSQTHLGRFVGQVLDGTFWPMIGRKLGAMLHTLLSPNLMPIVLAGLVFLVFAVLRPGQVSAGLVPRAFARAPMLRAGLVGALASGVVGMLVNDSGTAVLSMAVALAVPLVLHAGVRLPAEEEPLGRAVDERGRHDDVLAGEV
ncbi:hypothetical protein HD597_005792 [Nonomuraea thailandensis]|uniref:Uncharacterized protein n=1 Tax=Nonomuraea thailandensis TaxID=1188745 RepID=A0A9X2GHN4_9ACTN|nr:hypothetical protein [Nonomuraea thailandensis]MCP2358772.1 hypothetical protein [Nonomuraea thailandensis]